MCKCICDHNRIPVGNLVANGRPVIKVNVCLIKLKAKLPMGYVK